MDVRAPVEFANGAFPSSHNVPILNDEQRHLIGTDYADNGQASAIELGLGMATPEIRAQRLTDWKKFVLANPNGYLYCFRGGLRSATTQQWLAQAGYHYPLIKGGYKALRRFLLNQLERLCERGNIVLVSGMTGVGKTELIQAHPSTIDIESRALHRGSAFGELFVEQPRQINWENQIIIDWLKCEAANDAPILIEAESHNIGKIHLPKVLQNAMTKAPRVTLIAPLAERVERLYNDYVLYQIAHFEKTEKTPWSALEKGVFDKLGRIRNRLGGARYKILCELLPGAIECARKQKDPTGFNQIISMLLTEYYDPQYQYHEEKNRANIIFKGHMTEINEWLRSR